MTTARSQIRQSMHDFVSEKNSGTEWYGLDSAHKEWLTENQDLFEEYIRQSAEKGSKSLMKDVIDSFSQKAMIRKGHAEQLPLDLGLAGSYSVPNPDGDGNLYVPALQMTLHLFSGHREILHDNVSAASKALDDFDLMIDSLRPFMKDEESTLGDALDAMERAAS